MTPAPGIASSVKRLARACLGTIPVGVWSQLLPKDIIALCYHVVSDEELPHHLLYSYKTPAQFERDVEYVASRAISYDEASALRRREVRLPSHRFLITFDDGFSQCFDVVRPILGRHRAPGVFFVNVDFLDDKRPFFEATMSSCLRAVAALEVDRAADILARLRVDPEARSGSATPDRDLALQRLRAARIRLPASDAHTALALSVLGFEEDGEAALASIAGALGLPAGGSAAGGMFMTSDQVRQLAAEGFTIGSHGFTHPRMQRLGRDEIRSAVVGSCAAIRDLTGQERVPFAFPYSASGIDRSLLAEIIRLHPFVDLFFDTQAFRRDAPFVVHRIAADSPPSPGDLGSNVPTLLRSAWSRRSAWYRDRAPHGPSGA